jgi:hypothetical protein
VVYELPFGKNKTFVKAVPWPGLGRLTANTIVDWSSGYPYSVDAGRGTFYPGVNSTRFSLAIPPRSAVW